MSRYSRMINGRQALANLIKKPINKAQRKRGFAEGRLLTEWPKIVGPALSAHCIPQKLSYPKDQHGATLHLLCEAGWATELQFQNELLCDKIATFFGYRAVGAIRIHQGPLPKTEQKTAKPSAISIQETDDALTDALTRFAKLREQQNLAKQGFDEHNRRNEYTPNEE